MQWNRSIGRWLTAERSNDDRGAESALQEIFALLRDPLPPAGFAQAVLSGLGARPRPAAFPLPARWAIAMAMVAAALSIAVSPLVLMLISRLVHPGALVDLAGVALIGASRGLASWLAFWQSLAEASVVLWSLVSRPSVAASLLAFLAVSLLALRLFGSLIASDRSTGYA